MRQRIDVVYDDCDVHVNAVFDYGRQAADAISPLAAMPSPYVLAEIGRGHAVALLEEMDFVPSCDIIVLVTAPYEKRLERALSRDGMTADAFRARSDAQKEIGLSLFSSGKRIVTIFNNSGMEDLRKQAEYFSEALA